MSTPYQLPDAAELDKSWKTDARWAGISRGYTAADVVRLRGSIPIDYSIARITADKLWRSMQ